jgi:hypothetical protein
MITAATRYLFPILLGLYLLAAAPAAAQRYVLRILPAPGTDRAALAQHTKALPANRQSVKKLRKATKALWARMQEAGYLVASADSLWQTADTVNLLLSLGLRYKWISLNTRPDDTNVIQSMGFHPKTWFTGPQDPPEIIDWTQGELRRKRPGHNQLPLPYFDKINTIADGGVTARLNIRFFDLHR